MAPRLDRIDGLAYRRRATHHRISTSTQRAWRAAWLIGLASLGAGCRPGGGPFARRDPVAEANAATTARLATMPLPNAPDRLELPGARVRVAVTARAIGVDDAALVASWPPETRARVAEAQTDGGASAAEPVVRPDLVALDNGRVWAGALEGGENGFLIVPLRDALASFASLERARASVASGAFDGVLEVYAEPGTSASTLFRVLYTAGQVGYARQRLMLRAPDGSVTGYTLVLPRYASVQRAADGISAQSREAARRALEALANSPGFADLADASGDPGLSRAAPLRLGRHAEPRTSDDSTGDEAAVPPAEDPASALGDGPLVLVVRLVTNGYEIVANGRRLRPGCTTVVGVAAVGAAPTTERSAAALSACLAALRTRSPWAARWGDNRSVQIVSDGTATYGELITALLAARETRPGAGDLFRDVALGMTR